MFFRCSTKDAHRLQHDVARELSKHDLSHLGLFQAAARFLVNGEESAAAKALSGCPERGDPPSRS